MNDLIIEVKHGGLGDHLFHSHLPRIAKETSAYRCVFYSSRSVVRTPEIKDLVWKSNPFIDGVVDAPGTALNSSIPRLDKGNLLDAVMVQHGIDDGLRHHEPELFSDIGTLEEFRGVAIYDPNYVSFVGAVDPTFIIEYLRKECAENIRQIEPRERCYPVGAPAQTIATRSLREYCQIIRSCQKFYCLTSGSATLAAALKKPSTVFYGFGQDPIFHHSRQHTYVLASPVGMSTRARAILLRMRRKLFPGPGPFLPGDGSRNR
jgi:hypothetical protein